ncbi:protein ANTAGONIST OF LIKE HETEROCHROMATIN PROTEIN 1-like [Pararge aegeria]|nr:protein ANTAGONIST OF LIKE HETEROCHROMATIN PROTEIN 1-like [Pararge aegeria]
MTRSHWPVVISMSPEEVVLFSAAYIIIRKTLAKRKKKRWWVREYLLQRESSSLITSLRMRDGSFENFTRMSRTDFEILLNMVGPAVVKQDTKFRKSIDPHIRLAITLRYLATGDSYGSLSYTFRVPKSVICHTIPEVCKELIKALNSFVKTPTDVNEWKEKSRNFEILWNFPHCIGAIDGKHVLLEAPPNSGSDYYNYKENFSLVLLAIVDAEYNFVYVNCGAKGKSSDSGVFQETTFYKALNEEQLNLPDPEPLVQGGPKIPYVLVGDSAFALSENMMRPYPGIHEKGSLKRIFNYRLSRARRIVENVFGIMSVVFRVFRKAIPLRPVNAELVVMACVYLHNFLRRNTTSTARYTPNTTFDLEDAGHNVVEGSWRRELTNNNMRNLSRQGRPPPQSAQTIRNLFAEYFCSAQGSVPWQTIQS